jgi:hypothetical protein
MIATLDVPRAVLVVHFGVHARGIGHVVCAQRSEDESL